jgi:uncharacterized membrane protein
MAVHPLLLGALIISAGAFLVWPGTPLEKLQTLAAGVCAQRPSHSYFFDTAQLPLEARMGGIFAGFLVGVIWLVWENRERAGLLPSAPLQGLLLGLIALMGVDGVNALLFDVGGPALYPPQNALRLATGLLCGLALALLALPVLASALWRDWDAEPSLASAAELAGPACLLGLVQVATMSGVPALLYPVAVVMMLGLICCFSVGNVYAVTLMARLERRAATWRDALNPFVGGVLLTFYELVALSALRHWAETALGVRWPV